MLPLWRDQLRIVLCPDKVLIVKLRKGLRPYIISKHCIHSDPIVGAPLWFAPLHSLRHWLNKEMPKKADVVIILSNHFVRYGVLPWSEKIGNASEVRAFARIYFDKIYGDVSKKWAVTFSAAGYESPSVISAVDQELLDGLKDMFVKASLRIAAIEPYLMSAFNVWRKHFGKKKNRFLLVEPGKVCIVNIAENACQEVKGRLLQENSEAELANVLNRELMLDGADLGNKVYLCTVSQPDLKIDSRIFPGWESLKIAEVRGFSPVADAQFAMACVGVA